MTARTARQSDYLSLFSKMCVHKRHIHLSFSYLCLNSALTTATLLCPKKWGLRFFRFLFVPSTGAPHKINPYHSQCCARTITVHGHQLSAFRLCMAFQCRLRCLFKCKKFQKKKNLLNGFETFQAFLFLSQCFIFQQSVESTVGSFKSETLPIVCVYFFLSKTVPNTPLPRLP